LPDSQKTLFKQNKDLVPSSLINSFFDGEGINKKPPEGGFDVSWCLERNQTTDPRIIDPGKLRANPI